MLHRRSPAGLCGFAVAVTAAVVVALGSDGRTVELGSQGGHVSARLASATPRPAAGSAPGGIAGTSYATGFEPADGFAPGYIGGQSGWAGSPPSTAEGHIDTVMPLAGVQELRISRDPSISSISLVGAFSPNLGTFTDTSATVSVEMKINGGGARDYQVVPQAPTEGLVVTRVRFRNSGQIEVLDDLGSGAAFIDTGTSWTADQYVNVTVTLDVIAQRITVFYAGVQIYQTAGGSLPFGTAVQEVVLLATNGTIDEDADYDTFSITGGVALTGACCNFNGDNECRLMTSGDCAALPDAIFLGLGTSCADCPGAPGSCGSGSGPCGVPHAGPGCSDVVCCMSVCLDNPLCCLMEWDEACVEAACLQCALPPSCESCTVTAGDCFAVHGSPFCDGTCGASGACPGCCETICALDPLCCAFTWDVWCVGEAQALCFCTPQDAPANDDCINASPIDLGVTDVSNVCGTAGGPSHNGCNDAFVTGLGVDVWYSYTPDFDGALDIQPDVDSPWTTQMAVYQGCDCEMLSDPPLACAPLGGAATIAVTSGSCYLIRLGGTYDGPTGIGTLTLARPCPWDCGDGDGEVGIIDFLALLAAWGPCPGCPEDIDGDGSVGINDFLELLAAWGPCP